MPRSKRAADFAAGRRASSRAAEEYAQQQRGRAVSRRHGSLADQSDRAAGRTPQRRQGMPGARNLEEQSKQWKRQGKRAAPRKPNPGGYRSDDPRYQAKSQRYQDGANDGIRDCELVAQCPPAAPVGMSGEHDWSAMYRAGYRDEWANNSPHICDRNCPNNREK